MLKSSSISHSFLPFRKPTHTAVVAEHRPLPAVQALHDHVYGHPGGRQAAKECEEPQEGDPEQKTLTHDPDDLKEINDNKNVPR